MKFDIYITIEAPPSVIFPWLDEFDLQVQWSDDLIADETLEETPNKIGSKYRQVYRIDGREIEFLGETTQYVQNRSLGGVLRTEGITLEVLYTLKSLGYARTELFHQYNVIYHGVFRIFGPLIDLFSKRSSENKLRNCFARLKTLAEQDYQSR